MEIVLRDCKTITTKHKRTYQLKISIFRNVKFLQKRKKPEMRTSDDVTILTISFFLNSKYRARCFRQSDETRSYKCLGINTGNLKLGRFVLSPKFQTFRLEIKRTNHLVKSDQNICGQFWRVVFFDRSAHFGHSDWNIPFHLTTLLFPVPIFYILLTRTNQTCTGFGRVCATGMYRSIGQVEFSCTHPMSCSSA